MATTRDGGTLSERVSEPRQMSLVHLNQLRRTFKVQIIQPGKPGLSQDPAIAALAITSQLIKVDQEADHDVDG